MATQMQLARQGIITEAMIQVAAQEQLAPEVIRAGVAAGTIAVCCNINHKNLVPRGVGQGLAVKVNANIGTSSAYPDPEPELAKLRAAIDAGADSVMDLSTGDNIDASRKAIIAASTVMVGTVPIYQATVETIKKRGAVVEMTKEDLFEVIRQQAADGADFMTIHCGINRNTADRFKAMKRKMNIVSRGGSLIFAWMEATGNENPFFEYYDEILDICNEYDVTLSLGDACRPGCLADASDISQIEELVTLGELTARAWKKDVQVMIEGPGHMPMDQIQANMKIQQTICHGAPFYVLGPLVTDIAPGYDHITSAIGGAIAAASGASFLCYVTPAEHLRLPNVDDVKEGIMASKIAAHAADIAKGVKGAMDWDNQMAAARQKLDWEKQFELALDPEKARRYRAESTPEREDTCTMCGKMCSVRNMNAVLAGEDVDVI